MNRLGLALSLALAACTCPPTTHVEQTYAIPAMSDSIQLCASEGKCTILCARAFALDASSIDHCRILSLDHNGGAYIEVTWSEYVCTLEEGWSSDDDWSSSDDSDYEDDPCSGGACDPGDPDEYPDPPEEEDPPPDEEPPPDDEDDDWMDEAP